jgi:hypothetical protein
MKHQRHVHHLFQIAVELLAMGAYPLRLPFCMPSLAMSRPKTGSPRSQWDGVPSAELGWSPALLAEVQEKSARLHLTAVMVIRHRTVVAQ